MYILLLLYWLKGLSIEVPCNLLERVRQTELIVVCHKILVVVDREGRVAGWMQLSPEVQHRMLTTTPDNIMQSLRQGLLVVSLLTVYHII